MPVRVLGLLVWAEAGGDRMGERYEFKDVTKHLQRNDNKAPPLDGVPQICFPEYPEKPNPPLIVWIIVQMRRRVLKPYKHTNLKNENTS